jgi:hypothetical protein
MEKLSLDQIINAIAARFPPSRLSDDRNMGRVAR